MIAESVRARAQTRSARLFGVDIYREIASGRSGGGTPQKGQRRRPGVIGDGGAAGAERHAPAKARLSPKGQGRSAEEEQDIRAT